MKAVTIESPSATENITLFRAKRDMTVQEIAVILVGTTPTVSWSLVFDPTRTNTAPTYVTSSTSTSTTTGDFYKTFTNAKITSGSFAWLKTGATTGTVTSIGYTVFYSSSIP